MFRKKLKENKKQKTKNRIELIIKEFGKKNRVITEADLKGHSIIIKDKDEILIDTTLRKPLLVKTSDQKRS